MDTVMIGTVAVVIIVYLLIIGISIANYVMTAMSLHRIGTRRLIPNSWLAFLPIANSWVIGKIADDYDEKNGIERKWSVVLLVMSIISTVGFVITYVAMFVCMIRMAFQVEYYEPAVEEIVGPMVLIYVFLILAAIVASAYSFCTAICIYKIFESTVPKKAVKYMLLYLLVPLAGPICLMKCKEQGYAKELVPVAAEPTYEAMGQKTEIEEETQSEE